MQVAALLALEDNTVFYGKSIGAIGNTVGEVIFNTAMTGYQEILTDPSYAQQIITLTHPHIGNTGINKTDEECTQIHAVGLVVRNLPSKFSNWRSQLSLGKYLSSNNIVAISDIDTRALTRHLQSRGALNGCITVGNNANEQEAIKKAKSFAGIKNTDLAKLVSTTKSYKFKKPNAKFKVVVYDYGVKQNILRILAAKGCDLTIVNAQTPAKKVLSMKPDGVFLSNGPGDPEPCDYAICNIKVLLMAKIPIFGICLGHQLLSLANGASIEKMKFGHHGANHPVQDLKSKRVIISSQNHNFIVSEQNLPACLQVTHRSLFDGSIQGIKVIDKPAFSFQGHPEASPGPHDVQELFNIFIKDMENEKNTN